MGFRKKSFDALIGSISKLMSDEGTEAKSKKSPQQKSHDDEIQNAILVLAADVLRCDRNFTTETEWVIQNFLTQHFGAIGVKQKLKQVYKHIDTGTEPFTRIACKELKLLATQESLLQVVHFLFTVAAADDFANAKEIRRIERIATNLGISEKDFKNIRNQFLQENSPYFILGIGEEATWLEVKRAYRKAILRSHPDKRNKDMSEQEARIKFLEVQRAFEVISKERGKDSSSATI